MNGRTKTLATFTKLGALAAAAVMAATLATPANAQVGIYIGRTPPPLRYEVPPPVPGPGYSWIDGYWEPYRSNYRWVPGRYDHAPYPGAYWSHPHYDHYDRGWRMEGGHWDHEDHRDHFDGHR
jgi:hypothetical protein